MKRQDHVARKGASVKSALNTLAIRAAPCRPLPCCRARLRRCRTFSLGEGRRHGERDDPSSRHPHAAARHRPAGSGTRLGCHGQLDEPRDAVLRHAHRGVHGSRSSGDQRRADLARQRDALPSGQLGSFLRSDGRSLHDHRHRVLRRWGDDVGPGYRVGRRDRSRGRVQSVSHLRICGERGPDPPLRRRSLPAAVRGTVPGSGRRGQLRPGVEPDQLEPAAQRRAHGEGLPAHIQAGRVAEALQGRLAYVGRAARSRSERVHAATTGGSWEPPEARLPTAIQHSAAMCSPRPFPGRTNS